MAQSARNGGILVTGDKFIDKALAEFDDKVQKKITRKATREGAKLVLERAKALAPWREGTLEQSLKVRAKKRSRRGGIGHSVLASKDNSLFVGDTFYAGFLEYGTKERRHKSGKSVGRIEAGVHDFLRPALYQSTGPVRQMFNTAMKAAIGEMRAKKIGGPRA